MLELKVVQIFGNLFRENTQYLFSFDYGYFFLTIKSGQLFIINQSREEMFRNFCILHTCVKMASIKEQQDVVSTNHAKN